MANNDHEKNDDEKLQFLQVLGQGSIERREWVQYEGVLDVGWKVTPYAGKNMSRCVLESSSPGEVMLKN